MKKLIPFIFLFITNSVQAQELKQKVVGGTNCQPQEFQFLAGIGNRNGNTRNTEDVFCGGSLIAPGWILTAAHCLYDDNGDPIAADKMFAFLKTHNLVVPNANQELHNIELKIEHSMYDNNTLDYDICLLKLETPSSVKPVTLPSQGDASLMAVDQVCTVAGWGATNKAATQYPNVRKKADVKVISTTQCNEATWYNNEITSKMFCAGYADGDIDACSGDSGGPLFVSSSSDTTQIGIVSWGYGCAEAKQPGVYTKVNEFITWINDNIQVNAAVTSLKDQDVFIAQSTDGLIIKNNNLQPVTLELVSMNGQVVKTINVDASVAKEVQLNKGMYVARLAGQENFAYQKVVVW